MNDKISPYYRKGHQDGVYLRQHGMDSHPLQCPFVDPDAINTWRVGLHDGWRYAAKKYGDLDFALELAGI